MSNKGDLSMAFEFNWRFSLLAVLLNVPLVFIVNANITLFPLDVPAQFDLWDLAPALAVQFIISSIVPGLVQPMARTAGKDQSASLVYALYSGSLIPGAIVFVLGGFLHLIASTPDYLATVFTIVSLTVIPCGILVLYLRFCKH